MAKPGGLFRFTYVLAENWRNFTRVESFLRGRAIFTGPNASGKSNLLDVFQFLHEIAAGGGFEAAVERRGGMTRLRSMAAPASAEVGIAVRCAGEEGEPEWEYELRFAADAQRRPVIVRERVAAGGREILARPDARDAADSRRLSASALEHIHSNGEFRELADLFGSVRAIREASGGLLDGMATMPENTVHSRLRRILELIQPLVPHLEALDFKRDVRGLPHLRARFGYSQGAWQMEDQLSGGTLRMVALLWAALDGAGPLLIEEPERSLDDFAAREIASLLRAAGRRGERQLLLATNSGELLSDEDIVPEEVLVLKPGEDGTTAHVPSCFATPADEGQLALFGEE